MYPHSVVVLYSCPFSFDAGAFVEVYSDHEKNLKGIFFQDQQMRECFKAYPELLCIDATYKLLELGLPVYLFLVEDSNGQSEIVAVCLLVAEDHDSMCWMFESFKKLNPEWSQVRVVMADKDIGERDVIKEQLPNARVLICLFHTLRSLKREISCEKMGITSGQRLHCLELLQKMAYAVSEAEYQKIYSDFERSAPRVVKSYFNENWRDIRDEWILGLKCSSGNFLNSTNNRLESINGKLKQVVNRHSSLEDFLEKFFIILTTLRTERDHKAALLFQKVKVTPYREDSPQCMYSRLLTSYAATFVHKQLDMASKVSSITEENGIHIVNTSEGRKHVTESSCECLFFNSMLLPCRHIFALRSKLGLSLYDSDLCNVRWTTAYYRSTHRIFSSFSADCGVALTSSKQQRRVLSQHQKFRKASILASELATIASYASKAHFDRRLRLLKELIDYWKNGEEVGLTELTESKLSLHKHNS